VEVNSASDPLGPVADFGGSHNLVVATGGDSSITLDAEGELGSLLRASGHLKLDVFGFVQAEGDLALQKSSGEVKLGDGSTVQADLLTLGASGLSAFAGVNGGTANAMGLQLEDVELGLALISDQDDPARSWTALSAHAGSVGVVGVPNLTLQAD